MILNVWPTRAQFRPNENVDLMVSVSEAEPATLRLNIRVLEDSKEQYVGEHRLEVGNGGVGTLQLAIPELALASAGDGPSGCAVEATATSGETTVRATTAFDVARHWSEVPRYGFFSDFAPDETEQEAERRADLLLRLHVNVVQFYDWMASHHTFIPESEEFTDPLDRRLDRKSVV